jgi:GTPase SAR1 family protein
MVLVGNKCDLVEQRVVPTKQGEELAKKFSCVFLEASARTRDNIDNIFHSLVRQINPAKKKAPKKGKEGGCTLI